MSNAGTPAVPRLAATLLLVRDGAAGIEVLMVRRHDASSFAAIWSCTDAGALASERTLPPRRSSNSKVKPVFVEVTTVRYGIVEFPLKPRF